MLTMLVLLGSPFVLGIGLYARAMILGGVYQKGDVAVVELKALGYFPFNENTGTISEIPQKWRDLDGKRVELQGYMFNRQSARDEVSNFEFVYNVQVCCFGGSPLVQERVFAHVPHGRSVPFDDRLCRLTGVLHVGVNRDNAPDGLNPILSLYTLDVEKIERP